MLIVAALVGLGGGKFASSMANISFFYPDRIRGWALGLNAAGGNIGVSTVQLLLPILMGRGVINLYLGPPGTGGTYIQNAGLMWFLPLAIAVFCAYRYMNNLTEAKSSFHDQPAIIRRKHTWIMSWIYIETFGSFIDYSAAVPLLIKTRFPAITISVAFIGPLVGSIARSFGGLRADKIGGAKVTFWNLSR